MSEEEKDQLIKGVKVSPVISKSGLLVREIVFDDFSTLVPGSKEKVEHLKGVRSKYIDKPKLE